MGVELSDHVENVGNDYNSMKVNVSQDTPDFFCSIVARKIKHSKSQNWAILDHSICYRGLHSRAMGVHNAAKYKLERRSVTDVWSRCLGLLPRYPSRGMLISSVK